MCFFIEFVLFLPFDRLIKRDCLHRIIWSSISCMRNILVVLLLVLVGTRVWAQTPADSIIISEINYNPAGPGSDALEFVEIYNRTQTPVDISGYILAYSLADEVLPSLYFRDTLKAGTILPPLGRIVFARDSTMISQMYNYPGSYQLDTSINGFYIRFNDVAGMFWFTRPNGLIIDTVRYYSTSGILVNDWPDATEGAAGLGASICLCDENRGNDTGYYWSAAVNGVHGYFNGLRLRANPGTDCAAAVEALSVTVETPTVIKVAFNQILKFPSLFTPVDIGCFDVIPGYPALPTITSITAIPNPLCDTVILNLASPLISGVFYSLVVKPTAPGGGAILGRTNNLGTPVMLVPDTFIFGFNILPSTQMPLIISEIFYDQPGDDSLEFVEVFNTSTTATIRLGALRFTKGIDFVFPDSLLTPRTYAIIAKNAKAVRNFFKLPPSVYVFQWQPTPQGFLEDGGELLEIRNTQNQVIDSVHYRNSRPWASYASGRGSSLMLCDTVNYSVSLPIGLPPYYQLYNDDPCNWTADTIGNFKGLLSDGSRIFATPGAGYNCIKPTVSIGLPYQVGIDSLVLRPSLNPVRPVQSYTWTSYWPVRPTYNITRSVDTLRVDTSGHYFVTIYDSLYGCQQSNAVRVRIRDADTLVFHTDLPVKTERDVVVPQFSVLALNSALQIEETYDDTIRLRIFSGPAGGRMLGDTAVRAVKGVAKFGNIRFTREGTYVLYANARTRGKIPFFDNDPFYNDTLGSDISANIDVTDQVTKTLMFVNPPRRLAKQTPAAPILVHALNNSGNIERSFYGRCRLFLQSGPDGGRIISGDTIKEAEGGYVSFENVTFNIPGTYVLGVHSGWLTASYYPVVFVYDTAVCALRFTVENRLVTVNRPIRGLCVQAISCDGRIDTTFSGAITLTYKDKTGPADPVTGTFTVNAVKGIACFNDIRVSQPGVYEFFAKTGIVIDSAFSGDITAEWPTPRYLALKDVTPEFVMQTRFPRFTVEVLDIDSVIVPTFNDYIQISAIVVQRPGASIAGQLIAKAAKGIATFEDVQFSAQGWYTIEARHSNLTDTAIVYIKQNTAVDPLAVELNLQVYPNPSNTGEFNVRFDGRQQSKLEVLDAQGRVVLRSSGEDRVDLSQEAAGLYRLRIITAKGVIMTNLLKH
jgi:hypothetical protein